MSKWRKYDEAPHMCSMLISCVDVALRNGIKAVIRMETVILEDGIKWSDGNFFKPSESAPGGYVRIDQ
jgi:hypothetical protein